MKLNTLSLLMSAVCLTLVACGDKPKVEVAPFDQMRDVATAPPAIRKAADAVVKILTESGNGTGFFVSPNGQLMTNNHVLGIDESLCAREGCYIDIQRQFQRESQYVAPVEVFAEPLHVSAELDASLFQLWTDGTKTQPVASPDFLTWDSETGDVDRTLTAVGHPAGGLKKWATGKLYHRRGAYFWMDSYLLPGASGSPILTNEGKLVGQLHRVTNTIDRITRKDPNHFSVGSWGTYLTSWLRAGNRRDLFFSIKDAVSVADAAANYDAYLMAHEGQAEIFGMGKISLLEILATKCQEALDRKKVGSTDALEKELVPCSRAWSYLNCHNPDDGKGYKSCPVGPEKEAWNQRFRRAAELTEQFHSARQMSFLLAPSRLENSPEAGKKVSIEKLEAYVRRVSPPLTFFLADTLLTLYGAGTKYNGESVAFFVKHYRRAPRYHFSWEEIVDGHLTLFDGGGLDRAEITRALTRMLQDNKMDVGNKLSIEAAAFRLGLF